MELKPLDTSLGAVNTTDATPSKSVSHAWCCVHTYWQKESISSKSLAAAGVATFLPEIRRAHPNFPRYLFPQYIFAQCEAQQYSAVQNARGVDRILSVRGTPVEVAEAIIEEIRGRMDGGVVRLGSYQAGDRVKIVNGPYLDLDGMFEQDHGLRVTVLLQMMGRVMRYQCDREAIKILKSAEA